MADRWVKRCSPELQNHRGTGPVVREPGGWGQFSDKDAEVTVASTRPTKPYPRRNQLCDLWI